MFAPKKWAILVGAGYYSGGALHLNGDEDAKRVKRYLDARPEEITIRMFASTAPEENPTGRWVNNRTTGTRTADWPRENPADWPTWTNVKNALQERLDIARADVDRRFDLVLFHFSGHGRAGGRLVDCLGVAIEPNVLCNYFTEMANIGLVVTVILDCCYSAGWQPAESELSGLYPGLGAMPNYNLLAACSPYQEAPETQSSELKESTKLNRRIGGLLTVTMLMALNDNPACTLKMIQRRLFPAGVAGFDQSMSMLKERDPWNSSFFDSEPSTPRRFPRSIAALWTDKSTVQLAAGIAHGIVHGSLYTIYPWDATDFSSATPQFRVQEVTAMQSTAKVVSAEAGAVPFAQARHYPPACQAVLVEPTHGNNLAPQWAEYRRLRDLPSPTTRDTTSHLPVEFEFGVLVPNARPPAPQLTPSERTYDVYQAAAGSKLTLRFKMQKNTTHRFVRLTVLQFLATGAIRKYYPRAMDYEVVTPDAECVFEIVRNMRGKADSATVTFKAFIALPPTSFDPITRFGIVSDGTAVDVAHEENRRVPVVQDVGQREYEQFKNTRVALEKMPEPRWRTMSVTIHTTRAALLESLATDRAGSVQETEMQGKDIKQVFVS